MLCGVGQPNGGVLRDPLAPVSCVCVRREATEGTGGACFSVISPEGGGVPPPDSPLRAGFVQWLVRPPAF